MVFTTYDPMGLSPTGNPHKDVSMFKKLISRPETTQITNLLDVYESMYGVGFKKVDDDTKEGRYLSEEEIYNILNDLEGGDADKKYSLEETGSKMFGDENAKEEARRISMFWKLYQDFPAGRRSRKTKRKSRKRNINKRKSRKRKINKRKSIKRKMNKQNKKIIK